MAIKSWLVGLAPTDTQWEQEDASASFLHRSSSTPDLASEAGTTRVAPATIRAHSASPRRQPTLEWKRRLVDGHVGYGDQTSLFGPSGLENMFARPQAADSGLQKEKTHKTTKKTRVSAAPSSPPTQTYTNDEQEQGGSPRESISSRSSAESEMLASLCEGMDLVAMRTATIKKALADLIDSQGNGNNTEKNNQDALKEQHAHLHPKPAAADHATDRITDETNLENISPVVVAKRTTIDGKVSYNAYSPKKSRAAIIQERKGIDKTDTSQRAREIALAMGDGTSAVSGAEDGSFMNESRQISGFTDAPEVESDKPTKQHNKKDPESWDFTDPPMGESSELAAAARNRNTRSPVRFGSHRLESSTFDLSIPAEHGEDSEHESMEDFDGTLGNLTNLTDLNDYNNKHIVDTKDADHTARLIMLAVRAEVAQKMKRQEAHRQTPKVTVTRASGSRRTKLEVSVDKRSHSPITSPTPKRRRTLHGSELQAESIKTVLFQDMPKSPSLPKHAGPQPNALPQHTSSRKRDNALPGEAPKPASPAVLEQRKIARQRNVTPSMGPSTGDWLQECKRVIGASRANELGGIQEADEDEAEQQGAEWEREEHKAHDDERDFNTKKSDNMKTLAPQEVAHLLGGEVKGMTFDKDKNRWVRTKSAEHRFLDPKDALSSDDDPFRDISDLTAEKSVRSGRAPTKNESTHGATTVIMNHEAHVDLAEVLSSSPPAHTGARRTDTPQQDESFAYDESKLPGEESTLAHYNDEHTSDPEALGFSSLSLNENTRPDIEEDDDLVGYAEVHDGDRDVVDETIDLSTSAERTVDRPLPERILMGPRRERAARNSEQLPKRPCGGAVGAPAVAAATTSTTPSIGSAVVFPVPPKHRVPTEIRTIQVNNIPDTPNANISNTLFLSDLPEFTVHEDDHERPSERALAARLARYAQLEAADPFALTRKELVKAIMDIQGQTVHWEDITDLCLASKGLTSIHGLDEHCGRVEKLDISRNALTQVDGAPPFLRQLDATFNQITSLTSWGSLMNLQYLDLSNNDLDNLDGLSHLIHLRELRVDDNHITTIDGIIELDGLISFSARRNQIQSVHLEHFKLDRLIELDLGENNITCLDGLENLPCLRKLCLDSNPLGETMREPAKLPTLKHLSLRNCGLESLNVEGFPKLRRLNVDQNKLSSIDGLGQLKQLKFLSMIGQNLAPGVHITILEKRIEVEEIIVGDNELPRLNPNAICMSVKHLAAFNTGLQELPKDFGVKFPNLHTLDLSYNGLKDIRPLASLSRLEHLDLTGCSVDRLRKTVATLGEMEDLVSVDLRGTPLTKGFYERRRDREAAMSKETYRILIRSACKKLGMLDGKDFLDLGDEVDRDLVMERLIAVGVMRPSA